MVAYLLAGERVLRPLSRLRDWLVADLERAGVPLERVVPARTPAERVEPVSGHFLPGPPGREDAPRLVLSDASGVACLSAEGSLIATYELKKMLSDGTMDSESGEIKIK